MSAFVKPSGSGIVLAILSMVAISGCDRPGLEGDGRSVVLDAFVEDLALRSQFDGNILIL